MLKLPQESVGPIRSRLEGKIVCVTGGAGFIGGHLVDALLSLGCRIQVIDDLSNSKADHVAELVEMDPERVQFIQGSILDDAALADAMSGAERALGDELLQGLGELDVERGGARS